MAPINSGGHLEVSETTLRQLPKRKAPQKRKRRPKTTKHVEDEEIRPAIGTLSRTKSLLLAALRVWELKQGIRD